MDWYYQVLSKGTRIALLDQSYIAYRQRPGSVTAVVKEKTIGDFIRVLQTWSGRFQKELTGERRRVMLQSMTKLYCNLLVAFVRYQGENRKEYREKIKALAFLFSITKMPAPGSLRKSTVWPASGACCGF
mgnify:CR=1 FL=1